MNRYLQLFLAFNTLLLASGCNDFKVWWAKEFRQAEIASGVSRLLVQHMSLYTAEAAKLFDDKTKDIKTTISHDSDPDALGKGTVTEVIENVSINYPEEQEVYTSCADDAGNIERGLMQGGLEIIEVKRQIYGRLTGDKTKPVMPDSDRIEISLKVRPKNMNVRFLTKEGNLELDGGELHFTARPRLARDQKSGLIAARTSNMSFSNVSARQISGLLMTKDITMPIPIEHGELFAQVGMGSDGKENILAGKLRIFGNSHEVAHDGGVLDPNYSREAFIKTYSCWEGLEGQVSFEGVPLEERLAPGLAGISSLVMGYIAKKLDDNLDCGFASIKALENATVNGIEGQIGSYHIPVRDICHIHFDALESPSDCFGWAYRISGHAKVIEADRSLMGINLNDQDGFAIVLNSYIKDVQAGKSKAELDQLRPNPVIPSFRQPIKVSILADLTNFHVEKICQKSGSLDHKLHCSKTKSAEPKFAIEKGRVKAELKPLLAKNEDPEDMKGMLCASPTPITEATLELKDMIASIDKDGKRFSMPAHGKYSLLNGYIKDRENEIRGSIFIGKQEIQFSNAKKSFTQLVPTYNHEDFNNSFLVCSKIKVPKNDAECSADFALAPSIARLLVLNAGTLLLAAKSPEVRGSLATFGTLLHPEISFDAEENLDKFSIKTQINSPIYVDNINSLAISHDGNNDRREIFGTIQTLNAELIRVGVKMNSTIPLIGHLVDLVGAKMTGRKEIYVRPSKPDATQIVLSAHVNNYGAQRIKHDADSAEATLTIIDGQINLKARPIFSKDESIKGDNPSYSVESPIVIFEEIRVEKAPLILESPGKKIHIFVERAFIRAKNGFHNSDGNFIEGEIRFGIFPNPQEPDMSRLKTVKIARQALDPRFDQEYFDRSYKK
jgi:hypothetical protein